MMKQCIKTIKSTLLTLLLLLAFLSLKAQLSTPTFQSNPWGEEQLIAPAALAKLISNKEKVTIYNIGVVQRIKGAINIGGCAAPENLAHLKKTVEDQGKAEFIVIYCGCCPIGKCPNIRPAFQLLLDQQFSNVHLLNLPVNIKVDWMDKGYPVE
jgi:hypothetical protein